MISEAPAVLARAGQIAEILKVSKDAIAAHEIQDRMALATAPKVMLTVLELFLAAGLAGRINQPGGRSGYTWTGPRDTAVNSMKWFHLEREVNAVFERAGLKPIETRAPQQENPLPPTGSADRVSEAQPAPGKTTSAQRMRQAVEAGVPVESLPPTMKEALVILFAGAATKLTRQEVYAALPQFKWESLRTTILEMKRGGALVEDHEEQWDLPGNKRPRSPSLPVEPKPAPNTDQVLSENELGLLRRIDAGYHFIADLAGAADRSRPWVHTKLRELEDDGLIAVTQEPGAHWTLTKDGKEILAANPAPEATERPLPPAGSEVSAPPASATKHQEKQQAQAELANGKAAVGAPAPPAASAPKTAPPAGTLSARLVKHLEEYAEGLAGWCFDMNGEDGLDSTAAAAQKDHAEIEYLATLIKGGARLVSVRVIDRLDFMLDDYVQLLLCVGTDELEPLAEEARLLRDSLQAPETPAAKPTTVDKALAALRAKLAVAPGKPIKDREAKLDVLLQLEGMLPGPIADVLASIRGDFQEGA